MIEEGDIAGIRKLVLAGDVDINSLSTLGYAIQVQETERERERERGDQTQTPDSCLLSTSLSLSGVDRDDTHTSLCPGLSLTRGPY